MADIVELAGIESAEIRQHRIDLAAAFHVAAALGMQEGVANHFSLSVSDDGTKFLINPNQVHFLNSRASTLLLLDANEPDTLSQPGAPDPTAWGLHGAIHRRCPHARCVMHVHSTYATVLACLADSTLPPIDLATAMFFERHIIDDCIGGLAFEAEGERCASLLADPKNKVMVMCNHGILVIGESVADAFNRLYYFERASKTYIKALQTGRPLRIMSDDLARQISQELEDYPEQAERHFSEVRELYANGAPEVL